MKWRSTDTTPVAEAKAGFSTATGCRLEEDPRPRAKASAQSRHAATLTRPPHQRWRRDQGQPLCPFVHQAAIALLEKGVRFEIINIDLAAKPDWFLALSPMGKVPLLKVRQPDGTEAILFEMSAISAHGTV